MKSIRVACRKVDFLYRRQRPVNSYLDSRSHGKGVARQSPGLIHGPGWRHHLHDVAPPAVCSHGKPATDHLKRGGGRRVGRKADVCCWLKNFHALARYNLRYTSVLVQRVPFISCTV